MDAAQELPQMGRRQLILLMLGLSGGDKIDDGLRGITRLQKFIFLLEQEQGIKLEGENAFAFKAYKAGPYSKKIYDDLELLENLGLIRSESTGAATPEEHAALEELTFGHLLGSDAEALSSESAERAETSDTFDERRFTLTAEGRERIEKLIHSKGAGHFVEGVRKIKSKYANYSLQDLLHYVYTKYEDDGWIEESEIRDQVLSRRRSKA